MTAEIRSFQAQTRKLLDLMIHSIYSHKEIFLRELISNASDALDKVRFEALTNPELASGEHKIKLIPDAANHTLTIVDDGIGMSFDEVVEHIGTIAKSGSEAFAEKLKGVGNDAATPDLIGQFGVGFYSAFMVARRVLLETQKHGEAEAVRWESTGDGEYSIDRIAKRERGTRITLFLRDKEVETAQEAQEMPPNQQDFTETWTLREIVRKYSDFIAYPIVMDVEKYELEKDADGKPVEGGKSEKVMREETLNSQKALWTRQPSSIEKTEYHEFYRHLTRDWQEPSEILHLHMEGMQEYTALLFVPGKAAFDLYSREPRRGLQLYIKRVFIAEDVAELVPEYLRFVKGLVDSSDLPLNVSREVVQQDRLVGVIKKHLTNKILAHFKDMLEKDRPKYEALWKEFGTCIKEGFHYDPAQKQKLAEILLLPTTHGAGLATLKEIKERFVEGQTAFYYLTGDGREILEHAPQLEVFKKRSVEVILLGEPVDEILAGILDSYDDTPLKSAAKGELEGLPEDATAQETKAAQGDQFEELLKRLKTLLVDDVADVVLSSRLTDSAVCLVAGEDGMSGHLERMMRQMGQAMPPHKRVLEVNGQHAAIVALRDLADRDKEDERLREYAEMLLDQALLAEGAPLKNPAKFARRVADAMAQAATH